MLLAVDGALLGRLNVFFFLFQGDDNGVNLDVDPLLQLHIPGGDRVGFLPHESDEVLLEAQLLVEVHLELFNNHCVYLLGFDDLGQALSVDFDVASEVLYREQSVRFKVGLANRNTRVLAIRVQHDRSVLRVQQVLQHHVHHVLPDSQVHLHVHDVRVVLSGRAGSPLAESLTVLKDVDEDAGSLVVFLVLAVLVRG